MGEPSGHRLGDFVSSLRLSEMPKEVVRKAKTTLLHDLAVALAGHQMGNPACTIATKVSQVKPGQGARLFVEGTSVTVEAATLANASLMHARTQDDTFLPALTHVGSSTLPALLALGESQDAGGSAFLTAMVAGYEVVAAVAEPVAAITTDRGFRATSLYGRFGSAAACAKLLGGDRDEISAAIGLAASFGGGTNQTWVSGSGEWQYQVGAGGKDGLVAALLAADGASGSPVALEGSAGYYRATAGLDPDYQFGLDRLGRTWRIMDVSYKPYPICAINQVPVWIVVDWFREMQLSAADVESLAIGLYAADAAYPGVDNRGPFSGLGGALMSVQFCLASGMLKGTVSAKDVAGLGSQRVAKLVQRIEVIHDPDIPPNACRLELTLKGGGRLAKDFFPEEIPFKWSWEETVANVERLRNECPSELDNSEAIIEVIDHFEEATVRDLVDLTVVAGPES